MRDTGRGPPGSRRRTRDADECCGSGCARNRYKALNPSNTEALKPSSDKSLKHS